MGAELEQALASLDAAVGSGFCDVRMLDDNDDFARLRALPRWSTLRARVVGAAADVPACARRMRRAAVG